MGRKPKPINERTNNLIAFRYPLQNPEYANALEKAYIIMRREGKNLGTVLSDALKEYTHRHYDLAFQHQLTAFTEEAPETKAQLEQEIVNQYTDKTLVRLDTIRRQLEENGYTDPKKRAQATIRITQTLTGEGVEVVR